MAPLPPLPISATPTTTETETETSSMTPSPTPPPPPPPPPLLRTHAPNLLYALGAGAGVGGSVHQTLRRPCKSPPNATSSIAASLSLPCSTTQLYSPSPSSSYATSQHYYEHYNSAHYCHDCLSSPSPPPPQQQQQQHQQPFVTTITEQALVHASSSLSSLATPPPLPPLLTRSLPLTQHDLPPPAPMVEHCSCGLTFTVHQQQQLQQHPETDVESEAIYEPPPLTVRFESPLPSTHYGSQSVYSSTSSNVYEYEQSTTNDSSEDYVSRKQANQTPFIHARCCHHSRSNAHAQTEFTYEQR